MKTCSRCGEQQPEQNFCKNRRAADGLSYRCRACESARRKPYNANQRALAQEFYNLAKQPNETLRDFAVRYFCETEGVIGLSNLIANWVAFDPETECYNWTGSLNNKGYGTYGVTLPTEPLSSVAVKAHRLVWALASGDLPASKEQVSGAQEVLDHKCSNRKCVNPLHLQVIPHSTNSSLKGVERTPTRFEELVLL